jgi:hypothetical protein
VKFDISVSTIDGEQVVEILDRGFLDAGRLRNAGVRYQHIEPVAYNFPDLFRDLVRAYRGCQIRPDRLGAPAPLTNLVDDAVGLSFTAAVMDQNLRAFSRQSQSARAADSAGSASHKSGFP